MTEDKRISTKEVLIVGGRRKGIILIGGIIGYNMDKLFDWTNGKSIAVEEGLR